jgi:glycerophosphoryl diester phosphodiesterase
MVGHRPLVVAHRGSSSARAEHTPAAYELALDEGADAVECDVRLTRDGHLVCLHDRSVDRTSDGSGTVSAMTLAELQRLDFGSWHDGGERAGILTFSALLALLREASRPVGLLVETKHPTRYGGRVELALAAALEGVGWTGGRSASRVTMMSFAETAVRRMKRLLPNLPTVLLMNAFSGARPGGQLPAGVTICGPSLALLQRDPGLVDRAHTVGNQVYVWTVDDPADIGFVVELGVDAVITDRPADALALIDSGR